MINQTLSFLAVAKAGGYTQASRQTGLSKAKLSRHVKDLEDMLGLKLLHRTTRQFALTEQGRKFYESCQPIENMFQAAVDELKHDFSKMSGTLKMTAPIDFGVHFLEPVVREFCQQYPLMNVQLSLSNVHEELAEKSYDLGIRVANELPDSNLRLIPLMQFQRIICATPQYLQQHSEPLSPDELNEHLCATIVNRSQQTIKPFWTLYDGKKLKNYALDHFIETDSYALQLKLIESGLCIGRLPSYQIKDSLEQGKLIELFPKIKKPTTYVSILYPDTMILPQKSRVFIDLLKLHFTKLT